VARDKSSEAATCAPGGAAGIGLSGRVGSVPVKKAIPLLVAISGLAKWVNACRIEEKGDIHVYDS